ncbi:MAG: LacI family transcriptional regulator [Sphaerochaetaceae bacterium]|nr:LacI family transcriptional regulator [Sphaerochaetaceae bacterium]
MGKSAVTILDVANRAGVSATTVSQSLNGKRPVNAKTKALIQKAIEELGYVPSYTASHMRAGSSGLLGCYVADITQDFTAFMLKGIEKALKGTGYSLIFVSGTDIGTNYSDVCSYFRKYNVDGLVSINHLSSLDQSSSNALMDIPTVFANSENLKYNCVLSANREAGALVADHLYEQGVRKPVFLGGPKSRLSVARRFLGFSKRFSTLGISIPDSSILYGDFTYDSGYQMVKEIVENSIEFDGLFCANDYIAIGAMKYLLEHGYKIPSDVKIVGFDDRDVSRYCSIPLTSVNQNLESIGELALDRLLEMIKEGDSATKIQYSKPNLIVRDSSLTS